MTTTTHDYRSLLASCRRNPDDDVLRGALADSIDEMDAPMVKCFLCKGEGKHRSGYVKCDSRGHHDVLTITECHECKGTGFVRDLTRARHAELLRVSVELNQRKPHAPAATVEHGENLKLARRESELTTALADYRPTCPVCRGVESRAAYYEDGHECACCSGTGRIGTWERGLLTLRVPTLNLLFHQYGNDAKAWAPTPWALTAVAEYPVAKIVVEDRVPLRDMRRFGWSDIADSPGAIGDTYYLPTVVFRQLYQHNIDKTWRHYAWFHTAQLALDALSTAFVLAIAAHGEKA